jgi:predicted HicB family RNase H-like nuclease
MVVEPMKKKTKANATGYYFTNAAIGKYAARYAQGSNMFRLAPETAVRVHRLARKRKQSPNAVLNRLVKRSLQRLES